MSPKRSPKGFKEEKSKRSFLDGLSTKVYDKNGKIVFNGMDDADAIMKRINPSRR